MRKVKAAGQNLRELATPTRDVWQEIVDKSGVVRVKIEGDNEPEPSVPREEGNVPFIFVGTKDAIENAKMLLEYHLTHLKQVRKPFQSITRLYFNKQVVQGTTSIAEKKRSGPQCPEQRSFPLLRSLPVKNV